MKKAEQQAWTFDFTCVKCGFHGIADESDVEAKQKSHYGFDVCCHAWIPCPKCGYAFIHDHEMMRHRVGEGHRRWRENGGKGPNNRVDGDIAALIPNHVYEAAEARFERKEALAWKVGKLFDEVTLEVVEGVFNHLKGLVATKRSNLNASHE